MPKLNAELITWRAPTTNADGSRIDYELAYELALVTNNTVGEPVATFPGRLNADGVYEVPADDVLPNVTFATYEITLRAFRVDQPALKSVWSNRVQFVYDQRVPSAPFLLD